jgi:hypothetical protein
MRETAGDLDLAKEPVHANERRYFGMENLDRDLPRMAEVVGQVDRGHSPAAELALDAVLAGQRVTDRFEEDHVGIGWRAAAGCR